MDKKPPKPSLGELAGWMADPVTQWVLRQTSNSFSSPLNFLPIKDPNQALMVNYYAGSKAALDRIKQLAENGS